MPTLASSYLDALCRILLSLWHQHDRTFILIFNPLNCAAVICFVCCRELYFAAGFSFLSVLDHDAMHHCNCRCFSGSSICNLMKPVWHPCLQPGSFRALLWLLFFGVVSGIIVPLLSYSSKRYFLISRCFSGRYRHHDVPKQNIKWGFTFAK